jgi:ribosome maturation protein SDO1
VIEWRNGAEKDLDNVLQIHNVFLNVSKGQAAAAADLAQAFGAAKSLDDIILDMLKRGELQVGDKERNAALERVRAEVVEFVAARVVDPRSKRVYTTGMIEKALDQLSAASHQPAAAAADKPADGDAAAEKPAEPAAPPAKALPSWTGVVTTKSAKSQALDAMRALVAHQPIPVARARMRLRISCPTTILKLSVKAPAKSDHAEGEAKAAGNVKERILEFVEQVESQDVNGGDWEVVGFVEPGAFKELTDFIGNNTKGKARAEILDMAVVHDGDS